MKESERVHQSSDLPAWAEETTVHALGRSWLFDKLRGGLKGVSDGVSEVRVLVDSSPLLP